MTSLVMILSLLLGAVVQGFIPGWPIFGSARPPVLLAVALYYALFHNRRFMFQAAILAGLLQDGLSLLPFGYSVCCFCIVCALVAKYRDELFLQHGLTRVLLGAAASGLSALMLGLLLSGGMHVALPVGAFMLRVLGMTLWGGVALPLVVLLMGRAERLVGLSSWRPA